MCNNESGCLVLHSVNSLLGEKRGNRHTLIRRTDTVYNNIHKVSKNVTFNTDVRVASSRQRSFRPLIH